MAARNHFPDGLIISFNVYIKLEYFVPMENRIESFFFSC